MMFTRFKLVDFGLAQTEPSYKEHVDPGYKGEHHGIVYFLLLLIMIYPSVTIAILKGAVNESVSGMMPSRAVRMSPRLAKKRNSQPIMSASLPPAASMLRSHKKENTTSIVTTSISGGHSVIPSDQRPHLVTTRAPSGRGRRSNSSAVGVARSTRRTSRRGSPKCNHSSTEVCTHCIQR